MSEGELALVFISSFAAVFALVGLWDIRRMRQARHAERLAKIEEE